MCVIGENMRAAAPATGKVKYVVDKFFESKFDGRQYGTLKIEPDGGGEEVRITVYPEPNNDDETLVFQYVKTLTAGATVQYIGLPGKGGKVVNAIIVPTSFKPDSQAQPSKPANPSVSSNQEYAPLQEVWERAMRGPELAAFSFQAQMMAEKYALVYEEARVAMEKQFQGLPGEAAARLTKDIATTIFIDLQRQPKRASIVAHPKFKQMMARLRERYPDKGVFEEKKEAMANWASGGETNSVRALTLDEVLKCLAQLG